MDTSFYLEFITIVESPNFAEAADKLSLSTSSLSRHLKAAEEELGQPLFDRRSRSVRLNEFGELFLPFARSMQEQQTHFLKEFQNRIDRANRRVTLASNHNLNFLLFTFSIHDPQYHVDLVSSRRQPLDNLTAGNCDLAVSINESYLRGIPDITAKCFDTDSLIIALHRSHPLAAQHILPISELENERFIYIIPPGSTQPLHNDLFVRSAFTPSKTHNASSAEEALSLVAQNLGVTITSKGVAGRLMSTNISILDIAGLVPRKIYVCRRNEKLSAGAEALWNYFDQYSAEYETII